MKNIFLVLHNIRSVHNAGSIFRTADAAGVSKIFLTGYTPTPLDRFNRPRKDFAKVSLGAEKTVPWEKIMNVQKCIESLKKKRVQVIALEQDEKAIDYRNVKTIFPLALMVGNEVTGISKTILSKVDTVVQIPMSGKKESLNVGVALGIALFRILPN